MIGARMALAGDNGSGQCPETPLQAISHHCSTDLARDGESDPLDRVVVPAIADQENEAGSCRPPSRVGSKEVDPLADRD